MPVTRVQKLSVLINVELVGGQEVFARGETLTVTTLAYLEFTTGHFLAYSS
jgi:hypothetical protein